MHGNLSRHGKAIGRAELDPIQTRPHKSNRNPSLNPRPRRKRKCLGAKGKRSARFVAAGYGGGIVRRFSKRNQLVTLSDLNVTPMLDLAFVLLIIL